ncbi:ABC transporter substrate-binding protein [Bradyrhizobium sp. 1.29L]
MNRRDVLTGALKLGAAFSISAPLVLPRRAQAATTISYAGWGGAFGEFVKEHWIKPFTAETGISVEYIMGPELAKVKAQVGSGDVQWDVVELGSQIYAGAKDGLWEEIDHKIIDPARFVRTPPPFAVPADIWVGGIAYDPSRTKHPANDFSQLWDVRNFPGRRALISYHANELFEVALLADGVDPSKLYPLDVSRAFKALERIKPDVKKWFAEPQQGVSLIQTNEADYTYAYGGRVRQASGSGVTIDLSFGQRLGGMAYRAVPRGCKRKEAAMRLIEFVTRPEQQVLLANKYGASPAIKGVEQQIDEKVRPWIFDFNNPKNVLMNDEYWGDHYFELDKRFKEWILT